MSQCYATPTTKILPFFAAFARALIPITTSCSSAVAKCISRSTEDSSG